MEKDTDKRNVELEPMRPAGEYLASPPLLPGDGVSVSCLFVVVTYP